MVVISAMGSRSLFEIGFSWSDQCHFALSCIFRNRSRVTNNIEGPKGHLIKMVHSLLSAYQVLLDGRGFQSDFKQSTLRVRNVM